MGEVYPNPVAYLPEEISPGYCTLVTAEPDLIVCESVGSYEPRNPEKTVPCGAVSAQLRTFLARQCAACPGVSLSCPAPYTD